MGKPDTLSRQEDHAEGIEDDNKGVVVITPDKISVTIHLFFAFLISICPTLLANAFPSHDDYYFFPLLSRWSS